MWVKQSKKMEKRWQEHINEANGPKENSCRALNAAILKYGADNFKLEILWEGPNDELDSEEEFQICFENTLYPDGYNLTPGGKSGGCVYYDEETRQKISDNHRKDDGGYDLPIYVRYFEENNRKGFKIQIPNKRQYSFSSSTLTLDEKYNLALDKYNEIINDVDDPNENNKKKSELSRDIPKYITYDIKRRRYIVRKPGFPIKYYGFHTYGEEGALIEAKIYLNSIN